MEECLGICLGMQILCKYSEEGDKAGLGFIDANVIKYREAYGSEVANKVWLQQFFNLNNNSNYKIGKDIDGISGATISVKSMSKGIQKIAILYPLIKNQF